MARDENGRWAPGSSGNPAGRRLERDPERAAVRALAREKTPAAIAALSAIAEDKSASPMARVRACEILIERGYGRASDESTLVAIDEAVIARDTPIIFQWQMGEPPDELVHDERPALPPPPA